MKLFGKIDYVPENVYKKRWAILGILCLALLIVMIGNTSLNVALPILSRVLHASSSQLQWMVDAYSLVFAGLLFTAGAFGDRFGRKGILLAGLSLFGLASAYSAFIANSSGGIIITRAVMGLAGAMIMPATLSILTNVFPPKERAKAVGIWAATTGIGVALGPILTGYLLKSHSWPTIFMINIPIILLTVLMGALLVPRTADPSHARLDPLGGLLSTVGLVAVVYAIIEAPAHGWLAGSTLSIGAIGLLTLATLVRWELRNKHPMLDVRLFMKPSFGISALALTLVFFALQGSFFSMALFLQLIHGYSALDASIRLLPVAGALTIAAPLSTPLAARVGKRRVVAGGMLTVSLGILLLSTVGITSSYIHLVAGLVVLAIGMGMAMSPTTDLLMSSVPKTRAGMGSAMNDTTRELGGALGIAVLGSLLASQYVSKIASSLTALPQATRTVAESSLAGALVVGQQIGGRTGATLIEAAKTAWMSGFQHSLLIGAAMIATAAVIAYFGLPDYSSDTIPEEGNFEVEKLDRQALPEVAD